MARGQGMAKGNQLLEQTEPVGVPLRVQSGLRPSGILDPDQTVIPLAVTQAPALQLARQPPATVETNIDAEGEPALQPKVAAAPLRMQQIKVEVRALPRLQLQAQGPRCHTIRQTGFHTLQDGNQAFDRAMGLQQALDQILFAGATGGQVVERPARAL